MELDDIHEYVLLATMIILIAPVNSSSLEMSFFFSHVFLMFSLCSLFFPQRASVLVRLKLMFIFIRVITGRLRTLTFVYGLTCVGYKTVILSSLGNLPDTWLN